jgi:hypothetical protein
MRNLTVFKQLEDDPTVQKLSTLWRWLEDGPGGTRHGPVIFGNLRLTSESGLLLLIYLAAVYITGTFFDPLRGAHFFVGFALIPPLALKLASTGWRFAHYYLGTARYRAAGPPWLLPRVLAPLMVAATIVAIVSGVILWAEGIKRGPWSTVHTDSIVVLLVLVAAHLAIHLRHAAAAARRDRGNRTSHWRCGAAVSALAFGLALGIVMGAIEPAWHGEARHHASEIAAYPRPSISDSTEVGLLMPLGLMGRIGP